MQTKPTSALAAARLRAVLLGSTLLAATLLLPTACGQHPTSFPPAPAAGEAWRAEAAQQLAPDPRFSRYAEQAELRRALARLEQYMGGKRRASSSSAKELAAASLITWQAIRKHFTGGCCIVLGYAPQLDEMEEAEEAYLDFDEATRIQLAKEVMAALLATPIHLQRVEGRRSQRYHSYSQLDVTDMQAQAGAFFAPNNPAPLHQPENGHYCAEECRDTLFKRMAARCMLEDVACNPALDLDTRCAAVACLRDICREGLACRVHPDDDDGWPGAAIVDALPLNGNGLELALFGAPAWTNIPGSPAAKQASMRTKIH